MGALSQHLPVWQSNCAYTLEQESICNTTLIPSFEPFNFFKIDRIGYSLMYDSRNRNPLWVCEHLTSDSVSGNIDRKQFDFKEDPNLPSHLRATLADYNGQGFDRGHLAPAADHRSNSDAMKDTFFLTNICPQCPELNRGYWYKLEKYVREMAKSFPNIHVITGPLYIPEQGPDDKRYVTYQVIGSNDVAVPTHFFKAIFIENWEGKIVIEAYILPNKAISLDVPLEEFKTSIYKIEKLAGFIFTGL